MAYDLNNSDVVVIIGSGYGGSIPAMRLAQAGMKVVVLERGPRLATSDLKQSDDPRYISKVVDLVVTDHTGTAGGRPEHEEQEGESQDGGQGDHSFGRSRVS